METQISIFQAILDLLCLEPFFVLGFALMGLLLYRLLKKEREMPKVKTVVGSMLLLYYLCIVFHHIVGIPTFSEFFRLYSLGESFFHPQINLIPLSDGLNIGFYLNIICFIPLGFFSALISRPFWEIKNALLLGLGISFMIEVSQMFTLYRATDINDLITNTLGTIIGCLCCRLFVKMRGIKPHTAVISSAEGDSVRWLPVLTAALAFTITCISG